MSSLAQEEARSISENVTWGHRKRFADGKVTIPYSRLFGYDKDKDGSLVVNPKQAVLVRHIYSMYLEGMSFAAIARTLTAEPETFTAAGTKTWQANSIRSILSSEKHRGDALLQKSYGSRLSHQNADRQPWGSSAVPRHRSPRGHHQPRSVGLR